MYPFAFRGSNPNPENASVIQEFRRRKLIRLAEILEMEQEFGQPRPDTELYDDAQIIFEMNEDWEVKQLPRYRTIMENYENATRSQKSRSVKRGPSD